MTHEEHDPRTFAAEAAYAQSLFRFALGDREASIQALYRSLDALPNHAPALLGVGSVEYQRGRSAEGLGHFLSLLELPDGTQDLHEILDRAGQFLIDRRDYADGLELYRRAAARFPDVGALHQGLACCAGHEGQFEEAVTASYAALALEPENQALASDLGWSLLQAGHLEEARGALERAVRMHPEDELATNNLRCCVERLGE